MTQRAGRRGPLALMLASVLFGCGDEEATQREAFIAYLQTRIVDKSGVHVARPTAEEAKNRGDDTQRYAIIIGFNDALSQRVTSPMNQALGRGAATSLQDLMTRRNDFVAIKRGMEDIRPELGKHFAAAEASRAALKQPPDLTPAFDAAYDRDVAGLARAFQAALPVAEDAMTAAIDVGDYLTQHHAAVTIRRMQIQVTDPAVQRDLNTRLAAFNAKGQEVSAAQRSLQSLISG